MKPFGVTRRRYAQKARQNKRYLAEPEAIYTKTMGMLLKLESCEHLDRERKLHKTADLEGLEACQQCGFCCLRMPCLPTPDELIKVAEHLGVSPAQLIKTKMVVYDSSNPYLLWARENQLDMVGKLLPYNRTWDRGYCIFFDKGTHDCSIYSVRPKAARQCRCWVDGVKYADPKRKWSKELLVKLCPDIDLSEDED